VITVLKKADVFAPEPKGLKEIILIGNLVGNIGDDLNSAILKDFGVPVEFIDCGGCLVMPGLIDPHMHLLGGSGEEGFSSQTPEIALSEILSAGNTTIVGTLGVDTTMKTLAGLLSKVKGLEEEGLSAFMYTGGYNVPPSTLTGTVRNDVMFINEIIAAGEVAISDERSTEPEERELARMVQEVYVGGLLSRKSGVTHFHVGEKDTRLRLLATLVDNFKIIPSCLYATHIERSSALINEGIRLSEKGIWLDMDTVEEDLPRNLATFKELGGDIGRLTISSDASGSSPKTRFSQIAACAKEGILPLEQLLCLATRNVASALKLTKKGALEPGLDADVLIVEKQTWKIRHLIARGIVLIRDGAMTKPEAFRKNSNRHISYVPEHEEVPKPV
jgi:beta-aspartyl-dipeptidase (metallo-type)